MDYINALKVFAPSAIAFFIGIGLTPFLTDFLYKHKMWKKKVGKQDLNGNDTPIFNKLHEKKDTGTPRMGGIIIWASTGITVLLFWLASVIWAENPLLQKLNFLSRNQTWLPLFTLIFASLIGLADDIMQVVGNGDKKSGLAFRWRLLVVTLLGLIGGLWFYTRLDFMLDIPFWHPISLGLWIIPLFIVVIVSLFSSGVIDGLDGLSGGIMAIIFAAYGAIALFQDQIDLAAFCMVVSGSTLAFLWFNIPPARFYMTETGILGLTTALAVVAFLTHSVLVLPIIAFPLLATAVSVIIQLASKKFRHGKKVFLVAPLHHHFEAIGWPATKVVMRYWVITVVTAIIGIVVALIGK